MKVVFLERSRIVSPRQSIGHQDLQLTNTPDIHEPSFCVVRSFLQFFANEKKKKDSYMRISFLRTNHDIPQSSKGVLVAEPDVFLARA